MRRSVDQALMCEYPHQQLGFQLVEPLKNPEAPAFKRRKTIVDAFQNLKIFPAAVDSNVAPGSLRTHHNWASGSPRNEKEIMIDVVASEDDVSTDDSDDDSILLSDQEKLERDTMRSLVLGRTQQERFLPQEDPVDRKLSDLIRGSMKQAQEQILNEMPCDMETVNAESTDQDLKSNCLPTEWQSTDGCDMSMDLD